MAFTIAPSIVTLLDDSIDTSIFYSLTEEEEKGNEKNTKLEVFFPASNVYESDFNISESESNLEYFLKKYTKPHLNLISPPPDFS